MVSFLGETKCHANMQHKVPGTRFFSEVSRCSIIRIELDEPTKNIVLYDLYDTDIRPMDVSLIPPGAYPYPNCLFVSAHYISCRLSFNYQICLFTSGHLSLFKKIKVH